MAFIYKIQNKINNKIYIGSANNYKNRWYAHKWKLKNNKHENLHLQDSWNKYGKENFEFSIVEECDEDIKFEREQYYLDKFNPFSPNGYNMCVKAGLGLMCEQDYKEREFNGEKHPLATITNKEVIIIKKLLADGTKQKYIVDTLNYSWGVVGKIASLNRWKEVGIEYNDKILSHQRRKWNDSMMKDIIKLRGEKKDWNEIGEILNFSSSPLMLRYNKFMNKDKNKKCVICGKDFIANSNN